MKKFKLFDWLRSKLAPDFEKTGIDYSPGIVVGLSDATSRNIFSRYLHKIKHRKVVIVLLSVAFIAMFGIVFLHQSMISNRDALKKEALIEKAQRSQVGSDNSTKSSNVITTNPTTSSSVSKSVASTGNTSEPVTATKNSIAATNTNTSNGTVSTTTAGSTNTDSSCVDNQPTVSADSLYPLQHVTTFNGTTFAADNFTDYGNRVQQPKGYVATDHAVPETGGLLINGYPDSVSGSVGGVTGGSGAIYDTNDEVSSSGGFDICFTMSTGDWQKVHLVLISWPDDENWDDGENDIFEGNPQSMQINIHEIGSSPSTNVYRGMWPSPLSNGQPHLISSRWDPINGYRFYLDGALVATAPVSSTVKVPTVGHHLCIQMQDTTESSTSDETATMYWMATYGYSSG